MNYNCRHGQKTRPTATTQPAAEQEARRRERGKAIAPRREGQTLQSGARAEGEEAAPQDPGRRHAEGDATGTSHEEIGEKLTRSLTAQEIRARVLEGIASEALAEVDEGLTTSNDAALWRGRAHLVKLLRELHHGV